MLMSSINNFNCFTLQIFDSDQIKFTEENDIINIFGLQNYINN